MIRWKRKGRDRHPVRTWLIRLGVLLVVTAGLYLVLGIIGLTSLPTEQFAWNHIRMVSGAAILGCLMAAVGYGNE